MAEDDPPDEEEPLGDIAEEVGADGPDDDPHETVPGDGSRSSRDGEGPNDGERHRTDRGMSRDGERAGPLSELANEVDRRRDHADSDELFDRAFDDVGVEDADALWEGLADDDLRPGVEQPDDGVDEETYRIETREYCQRCQFFSHPPRVECTYGGSEIVELEDTEHFRVRGCPIVEGTEDLEDPDR